MISTAIISNVILLLLALLFTNSWTVGTSNTKKVFKESLLFYVLPLLAIQLLLFIFTLYFKAEGNEKLSNIGFIILLILGFSPIWFFVLISIIGWTKQLFK